MSVPRPRVAMPHGQSWNPVTPTQVMTRGVGGVGYYGWTCPLGRVGFDADPTQPQSFTKFQRGAVDWER